MTIKPPSKGEKQVTQKPAQKPAPKPEPAPKAKPASPGKAKPTPATSTTSTVAAGPSGPDRALAARDMKRGLGGGGGFLWALLALAVAAGAGAATVNVWMPKLAETVTAYQAPRVAPERVQALEKELQSQKAAIAAVKSSPPPPPQSPVDDIKEIVSRLTKMETRLAALRKMVGATRPSETARTAVQSLQRLSGRLQSLEKNRKEVDAILKRIAATDRSLPGDEKEKLATKTVAGGRELVAATRELNRRIKSDKPFADVLARVKRLAGPDMSDKDMAVNIAALEPLAPSGVWTMDQLRREFPAAAAAILRVKSSPRGPLRAGTGWWDKTLNKLAAMVSLRRQGERGDKDEAAGRAAPRLVAAAEKAVSENDISTAVTALERLSGPRLAAAAAWLDRARGRQTAENAAAALNLFALTRLAGLVTAAKLPEKAAPEKNSPKITRE